MKRAFAPLFLALVGLSGFSSLVYQLVWERLARDNFGGDNISSTVVLTTFLAGLGIGAFLFRRAFKRPLAAYGLVEIGIGAFALVSPAVIANVATAMARAFPPTASGMEGLRVATIIGCGLFLLPPCILMGGTLPMMFGAFFSRSGLQPGRVGLLYGINMLGAMAGTVAVPAVLLNNLSITFVLRAQGAVSILVGVMSIGLHFTARSGPDTEHPDLPDSSADVAGRPQTPAAALAIAFLTGAVTVIYEVMLIRHSYMMIASSAYNISFVLLAVIFALAAGSIVLPRLVAVLGADVYTAIGVLLLAAAAGFTGSMALAERLIRHHSHLPDLEKLASTSAYYAALAAPLFLPMGAVFPMLCAASGSSRRSLLDGTGKLYLVNSTGAVAGALMFHALMGGRWGTAETAVAVAGALAAGGVMAFALRRRVALVVAGAVAGAVLMVLTARVDTTPFLLGPAAAQFPHLTVVEGSSGVASVGWYDTAGNGGVVSINGQGMGSIPNEPIDMKILAATLSVSRPRRVLVLGVATGSYLPPLLERPDVESVTLVDWSNEIVPLMKSDKIFVRGKHMDTLLADPRVRFVVADARVAVTMFPAASFDIIIDTLARPSWPGGTGLKSPEHFAQLARILSPDGILVLGTYFRGWRNATWSDSAWRPETIASVFRAFSHIQENTRAGILVASQQSVRASAEDVARATEDFAGSTRLGAEALGKILTDGFAPLSEADVRGVVPFSETELQSEYYYTTSDTLHFLWR